MQYNYSVSISRRKAFGDSLSKEEERLSEDDKPILTECGKKSCKFKEKKLSPAPKASPYQRIASHLLEFLIGRGAVILVNDIQAKERPIRKKKGSYYKDKSLFVQCQFRLKLLPLKVHLPMYDLPTSSLGNSALRAREV